MTHQAYKGWPWAASSLLFLCFLVFLHLLPYPLITSTAAAQDTVVERGESPTTSPKSSSERVDTQSNGAASVRRQRSSTANDLRGLTLDIFRTVARGDQPDVAAVRLQKLITGYRFSCLRVTDYQVFLLRTNMAVLKVKCSGEPMYGVTVASNGYRAVYGGDTIIGTFDVTDGPVLSFDAKGGEVEQQGPTTQEVIESTRDRVTLENEYGFAYLSLILLGIAVFLAFGVFLWLRAWRKSARRGKRRTHARSQKVPSVPLRPLKRSASIEGSLKDYVQSQSQLVAAHLYRHGDGFYIARGPRGRRRLFSNRLGGELYRLFNWHFFELKKLEDKYTKQFEAAQKASEDDAVAEGPLVEDAVVDEA